MSVVLRTLSLPGKLQGHIWLTSMPGRFAPLQDFMHAAHLVEATGVVCLAPKEEIAAKSPDYAQAIAAGSLSLNMVHHPIPDYGLPQDVVAFARLVQNLCVSLHQGQRLIVHCAAGIGRTGMVARHLLMELGVDAESAQAQVQSTGSGAETPEQDHFCNHPLRLRNHISNSLDYRTYRRLKYRILQQ
jgi:protein-tyrosine phosphatase